MLFDLVTETPKQTADGEITECFARRLEQTIRREPAYWFWSHKRWKINEKNLCNMDKIAVVILNWNGCDMLRSFLPSVVRFSEVDGAVVYVADNGSTDASVAMLRREFPSVHLILLEENHGLPTDTIWH